MNRSQSSGLGPVAAVWPFLGWTACGLGFATALLTPATIGLFAAAASAALALAMLRGGAHGSAPAGLIAGCAILALTVAYLNRSGPGEVCTATIRESSCVSEWSPWPWAATGVALLTGAVALLLRAIRAGRRR